MILIKRIKAFGHALSGVIFFFKEGIHAKIMLILGLFVLLLSFLLNLNLFEWITILLCIGLVLALEALNSAIEYLVDLASPEYHLLAKKCKDVAAAAVLIFSFFTALIGTLIFLPKIITLLNGF